MHSHRQAIKFALKWLQFAQDQAGDGGVAAWYSVITGWRPSYIETTGYIINTFFEGADYFHEVELEERALLMADFLASMQDATGGYRTVVPSVAILSPPTVFNCGQGLIGMTDAYLRTSRKSYLKSLTSAADFLVSIQEDNGSWIRYAYGHKSHVYHTRVAWGLLKVAEVYRQLNKSRKVNRYQKAAIKNLNWALSYQSDNGWFANNELPPPNIQIPYTHTISYALEGLLWSGLILEEDTYVQSVIKGASPLSKLFLKQKFLPGTFDENWRSIDKYSCLTGNAQLSLVWLSLFEITQEKGFWQAATAMNRYLRSVQNVVTKNNSIKGAIGGSAPLWGDILKNKGYCRLSYPNWATKFFIDALLKETKLKEKK